MTTKKPDEYTAPVREEPPHPPAMPRDTTTGEPPQIYARLAAIFAEVDAIPKGQYNKDQGFWFRGVDDVTKAMHDIFARWEVVPLPEVLSVHTEVRQGKNRPMNYVLLKVRYTFVTTDGSSAPVTTVGESLDVGDKAATKAMSNALKYALYQTFQIPTEETESDHESNEAVPAVDPWENATPARPANGNAQPAQQAPAQQPAQPAQQGHENAADLDALKAQLAGCKTPDAAKAFQRKIREMFKANKIAPNDANAALELVAARVKELEAA